MIQRSEFPDLPHGRRLLFGALAKAAIPEQELTVSEWADRHRRLAPESGSPFPGNWQTSRVEYLREPMDCLHPDHPARRITLKFSAQTGKSEVGVNWFSYIVDRAPGPMLTVLPTGDEATKYNRVKLQPTIDASPRIRHKVRNTNSRDETASTAAFKRFAGGFNQIVTASSSKGLQMVSVRWLILDEVSGYLRDVDGRGAPSEQALSRQKAFGDLAKELALSTPGMAGECEISDLYEAGDQRRCYLPCPHCGMFQVLKYDNMQPPLDATGFRATFGCEANGCIINQSAMPAMRAALRWVPTRVDEDEPPVPAIIDPADIDSHAIAPCTGRVRQWQPSWALWSAVSPFESWTDIWQRGAAANGDPLKEKVFCQQDLGEAYEPKTDTPDWEKLLAVRKTWPRGVVPYPACVLTGFIDVQGNRFEWGLWGWGPGFQGWLIDCGVIAHDFSTDAAWAALDQLTTRHWPTESDRELPVMAWGIDTGFSTQALYDRVAGRFAMSACKGDNRPRAAPLKRTRADLRDSSGRPFAGRRINLSLIGNFDLKMSIYEGLRHLVAGPTQEGRWPQGTLHLPDWIGEDELRQLTAEILVDPAAEVRGNTKKGMLAKPGDKREWRKKFRQANEALDIVVGCRALAWGEGAGQATAEIWQQFVAEAHGPRKSPEPDLFASPPLVPAPETPAPVESDVWERWAKLNSGL
jgi:phage terminase large subunit GpA-like protein